MTKAFPWRTAALALAALLLTGCAAASPAPHRAQDASPASISPPVPSSSSQASTSGGDGAEAASLPDAPRIPEKEPQLQNARDAEKLQPGETLDTFYQEHTVHRLTSRYILYPAVWPSELGDIPPYSGKGWMWLKILASTDFSDAAAPETAGVTVYDYDPA